MNACMTYLFSREQLRFVFRGKIESSSFQIAEELNDDLRAQERHLFL